VKSASACHKRRYQIDLAAQQAECELNYSRLLRLLHTFLDEKNPADQHYFGIGAYQEMIVRVIERCPYTTTLEISPTPLPVDSATPSLTVRVYHDARLAEVIACANRRRVQPRYEYPNEAMYQPDEKAQWNRFLGEWLSHCLQHGFNLDRPLSEFCEL
jgi:uncharacterized protein YqiB (DUF1249 family)